MLLRSGLLNTTYLRHSVALMILIAFSMIKLSHLRIKRQL